MNPHKETDKILNQVNKISKRTYLQAYKELKDYFLLEYSKIQLTPDMDAQQKLQEANKFNRVQKISEKIIEKLLSTNKKAISDVNKSLASVYQLNYNDAVESVSKDNISVGAINKKETKQEIKENENPFNEIAINTATDKAYLKKQINNSLLTSILQASNGAVAFGGIKQVFEKNLRSAVDIAMTQTTRLENLAKYQVFQEAEKEAEKNGLVLIKIWRTAGDSKVRDAHARAEGQEAQINKPFYVGGEKLMYPGDMAGSPGNIINCRCYMEYKFVKK